MHGGPAVLRRGRQGALQESAYSLAVRTHLHPRLLVQGLPGRWCCLVLQQLLLQPLQLQLLLQPLQLLQLLLQPLQLLQLLLQP